MIFISDVHHGLDSLKLLPKSKEPVVILGDLINWIDYRNGDGIAKEVQFGQLGQLRQRCNIGDLVIGEIKLVQFSQCRQ